MIPLLIVDCVPWHWGIKRLKATSHQTEHKKLLGWNIFREIFPLQETDSYEQNAPQTHCQGYMCHFIGVNF